MEILTNNKHTCLKCGNNEFEKDQFQATGGIFSKIFEIQNKKFITISKIIIALSRFLNLGFLVAPINLSLKLGFLKLNCS